MTNVNCPSCDAAVPVDAEAVEGEILQCADCSLELELINVDPPEVDVAPEVEEDWGE